MGLKRTGKIKKADTSSKIFEWENKLGTRKGCQTNSVRFIRLSGYKDKTSDLKFTAHAVNYTISYFFRYA